jgi:pimeloyl-ACP methyl ester carboxylesterase
MMWSSSVACLWTNESRLIFQAGRSRSRLPAAEKGLIQLTTSDGIRLDALSLTHERAQAYWILFCPPAGRSIHGQIRRHLKSLHAAGFNVLAFDYRGFGRNAGTPSEAGVYEDALTAYRHLTRQLDVAPERIILGGRSLGSAVAIELATRVPSGGLLLLSAIDSVPATASRFYFWAPVSLLTSQRFDSMVKAPRVTIPVLQVHAPGDFLVPIDAARALFRQFPGRKMMLELSPAATMTSGLPTSRSCVRWRSSGPIRVSRSRGPADSYPPTRMAPASRTNWTPTKKMAFRLRRSARPSVARVASPKSTIRSATLCP